MRTQSIAVATLLAALAPSAAGDVTISSTAPTTDILSSVDDGIVGIDTSLYDEDVDANHARGQLFALGDGAGTEFQITAITVKKSQTQAYVNDTITLRIFQGTSAQWDAGSGHSTATDGNDYFVDTGIAVADQLYTETFTLSGSITDNDFVTFELATPLTVDENSDFGFFMTYDQVGGTQNRFRHRENSNGGRISVTTSDHGVSSRNLIYYVQGTGLGSGGGSGLTTSASAPGDAVVAQPTGTSWTRSVHGGGSTAKTTRGNSFLMPDTGDSYAGYQVTGLTIKKDSVQSFSAGDALQLWVFAWDPATDGNDGSSWSQSGTNGTDDGDPLSGTGMDELLMGTYDLAGLTVDDGSFLTFDFSSAPLYLAENRTYGFLVGYMDGGNSASAYFQYAQPSNSPYADGVQIRTQNVPSANIIYSPWDVVFFIRGSVIDATISAVDTDEDGLSDAWEQLRFFGLSQTGSDDPDGDGLDNEAEETAGTDPNEKDSDFDGLEDDVEVAGPTDPLDPDSDDDDLLDGAETGTGVFVSYEDTGTDPMLSDTDNDGISDSVEITRGADPFDETHQPAQPPNIIFIMVDDLDTLEVGVYGQASLKTPRVDTMASQGMMFTDYYTASPVCQSCRSSLMTGQDSRRSQDRHNSAAALHPSRVTVAEVLKQAGYTTGCVGKWGLGGASSGGAPWDQGFDFFCGYLSQVNAHRFFPKFLWKNDQKIYFDQTLATAEGGSLYIPGAANLNNITRDWGDGFGNVCSHDVVVAEGLQFIEDNADKPFFLYCAWTPPHAYNYPAATVDALTDADGLLYDPLDLDQTLINEMYPGMPFGASATTPGLPEFQTHAYASMVSATDRDTGRIIDKLVELGIEDETLVIFCSDNGEAGATFLAPEHLQPGYSDLRDEKRSCYEGGIRAPFVARWPGKIPVGVTTDVIGTFADMLPTFADIAGLSTPAQITGRSILPVLLGGNEDDLQPRDYHYWCFTEGNRRWRAVRQGDWKIVRDRANNGSAPTYELFNLSTDPYEAIDLSSTEIDMLNQLIPLVEGTHEVTNSTYFKADDEFLTRTNLTASAYQIGTRDGSGADNGYSLTPSGTGSCFNYLPFSTGLSEEATFNWTMRFPSAGAASFLLGSANDPALCLAVRIDPSSLALEVSHEGSLVTGATLMAADIPDGRAECLMRFNPAIGAGEVVVGSTVMPFNLAGAIGPLQFWGFEVESSTVQTSRPRWQLGAATAGELRLGLGAGIIDATYRLPFTIGQSVTTQFSADLIHWYDHPPGLIDSRSANSQGQLQGSWHLPEDTLLPRHHDQLFFRSRIDP